MTAGHCVECGAAMFVDGVGVAYHGEPDAIDHDADADHTPLLEGDKDDDESEAARNARVGACPHCGSLSPWRCGCLDDEGMDYDEARDFARDEETSE